MAEQQRERDIAEMEAQMAHDTDQYFEARPQIMRTRDKETTFEAGFKAAWAARPLSHAEGEAVTFMRTWKSEPIYTCNKPGDMGGTYYPAPQVAGLTETAIKSSPAYRALHREKEHLLGLLKDQAPQVAVPEVSDTELRRAALFLDGLEPGGKEVRTLRKLLAAAAPTAPAGEPEKPRINVGSVGHVEEPVSDPDGLPSKKSVVQALSFLRSAVVGAQEWDNATDDAYEMVKAAALSTPAPDEREIAALREDAERYRFWREVLAGDEKAAMDLFEEELNRDVAIGNRPPTGEELDKAVDVARRLRAGKEGETS